MKTFSKLKISPMAANIKEVAKLAGVSPATVSRVLSGNSVSEDLRQRVLEAVHKSGYRPNLAARRLRKGRSDTIGLIVADIRNPFFTAVARAIDDIARKSGQCILLCNTDEDPERELSYLHLMEEEQVSGIILTATQETLKNPARLPKNAPVILIDRALAGLRFDSVTIDNQGAAAELTHHLFKTGHRTIACLYGGASITGSERNKGYEEAMKALGLKPLSIPACHDKKAAAKVFSTLISQKVLPDAVLVTNGLLMLRFAEFLMQEGIKMPGAFTLTGFDDEAWTRLAFGGLTVIRQPIEDIAEKAMTSLKNRIERPDAPINHVILESRLIVRR